MTHCNSINIYQMQRFTN